MAQAERDRAGLDWAAVGSADGRAESGTGGDVSGEGVNQSLLASGAGSTGGATDEP